MSDRNLPTGFDVKLQLLTQEVRSALPVFMIVGYEPKETSIICKGSTREIAMSIADACEKDSLLLQTLAKGIELYRDRLVKSMSKDEYYNSIESKLEITELDLRSKYTSWLLFAVGNGKRGFIANANPNEIKDAIIQGCESFEELDEILEEAIEEYRESIRIPTGCSDE